MKNLIQQDGSMDPHDWFTFTEGNNKDKKLQLRATQSDGRSVWQAIDTIKNLETGAYTNVKRLDLYRLKPVYEHTNNYTRNLNYK